jgi:hypothetical protein
MAVQYSSDKPIAKSQMFHWNDTASGASCCRTTPSFRMSKFCPAVTGLGPRPLEAAAMRLLRRRVPIGKPPLARRRRGAHNNGGEGTQKSATSEAKSGRGGSTDAASITVAPGGERPDGLVTEGDSAPRGGRVEYQAEGMSVWVT